MLLLLTARLVCQSCFLLWRFCLCCYCGWLLSLGLPLFVGLIRLPLGSRGDCSHIFSLYIVAMDPNSLGEALSPNAWVTNVEVSVATLVEC
ncbi:hypothetical protein NC652_034105 [Populus alba x Populus x berolinensis]|nr:hypothetical protein NC652_034105 [Populus alba x Populus x berolinensis]